MPDLDITQQDQLDSREGVDPKVLIWVRARNLTTDAIEGLGFWTGDDDQDFVVEGETRTYAGAGEVVNVPPIRAGIGIKVRRQNVEMPPFAPRVANALKAYALRKAAVQIHVQLMDVHTGNPLGAPIRMFKGTIDEMPRDLGPREGDNRLTFVLASMMRALTITPPLYKSNAALQLRNGADTGRKYSDVAGDWVVPWGSA